MHAAFYMIKYLSYIPEYLTTFILSSTASQQTIMSCESLSRKSSFAKGKSSKVIRCAHRDPASGQMEYFVTDKANSLGSWVGECTIELSVLLGHLYSRAALRQEKFSMRVRERRRTELDKMLIIEEQRRKQAEERRQKDIEQRRLEREREKEQRRLEKQRLREEKELRKREMIHRRRKEAELRRQQEAEERRIRELEDAKRREEEGKRLVEAKAAAAEMYKKAAAAAAEARTKARVCDAANERAKAEANAVSQVNDSDVAATVQEEKRLTEAKTPAAEMYKKAAAAEVRTESRECDIAKGRVKDEVNAVPQVYDTDAASNALKNIIGRHHDEVKYLLQDSAVLGLSSVPNELMTPVRQKNLLALEATNQILLCRGGDFVEEANLMHLLMQAESNAMENYIKETEAGAIGESAAEEEQTSTAIDKNTTAQTAQSCPKTTPTCAVPNYSAIPNSALQAESISHSQMKRPEKSYLQLETGHLSFGNDIISNRQASAYHQSAAQSLSEISEEKTQMLMHTLDSSERVQKMMCESYKASASTLSSTSSAWSSVTIPDQAWQMQTNQKQSLEDMQARKALTARCESKDITGSFLSHPQKTSDLGNHLQQILGHKENSTQSLGKHGPLELNSLSNQQEWIQQHRNAALWGLTGLQVKPVQYQASQIPELKSNNSNKTNCFRSDGQKLIKNQPYLDHLSQSNMASRIESKKDNATLESAVFNGQSLRDHNGQIISHQYFDGSPVNISQHYYHPQYQYFGGLGRHIDPSVSAPENCFELESKPLFSVESNELGNDFDQRTNREVSNVDRNSSVRSSPNQVNGTLSQNLQDYLPRKT